MRMVLWVGPYITFGGLELLTIYYVAAGLQALALRLLSRVKSRSVRGEPIGVLYVALQEYVSVK